MESFNTLEEIEQEAIKRLERRAVSNYTSASMGMVTLRENKDAYDRIKLKRAAEVDATRFQGTETEILGQKVKSPICIVSTAFQKMAHPLGEIATARAAEKTGTPQVLSVNANTTIEEIGELSP